MQDRHAVGRNSVLNDRARHEFFLLWRSRSRGSDRFAPLAHDRGNPDQSGS